MSNNVMQELPTTAFGELSTAQPTPLIQVTGQYGLRDDVLSAALGGTTSTIDSKFTCSTGTGPNNVSAIVSMREAQYRAGQGLVCRLTALFTQGVANNTQQAGFITSESAFCFGYNGTSFGILHSKGGELENQELTITTPASGSESASVTVDGVPFSIPITAGTVQQNAYEIATFLNANFPAYRYSSNDATVSAIGNLPDFGAGAFTFSSATAVGAWVEIQAGVTPPEAWIPKANWNVNPNISIDPTKGNVYQIQVQYLGFGGIKFFVEDSDTANFELVHIIKYANTSVLPSVANPIFRVGWATRNFGNTTDVIVQGASASAFTEGKIVFDASPRGFCQTQTGVGTTRLNVVGFRNRLTYNGPANRAEIIPRLLSLATDTTKIAIFEVIADPVPVAGSFLDWQFVDKSLSLMETTSSNVEIVGGTTLACFNATSASALVIQLEDILQFISPNSEFVITAKVSSGSGSEMTVSTTWKEDL